MPCVILSHRYSNCMEWTIHFRLHYLLVYPPAVTAYSGRTEPEYIKHPATRWCVFRTWLSAETYMNGLLGSLYFAWVEGCIVVGCRWWGAILLGQCVESMLLIQLYYWWVVQSRSSLFSDVMWIRLQQWVFDGVSALNVGWPLLPELSQGCHCWFDQCVSLHRSIRNGWETETIIRISTTLISRLMLHLRDPKVTDPTGFLVYPLSHPNVVFAMQSSGTAIGADTEIAPAPVPWQTLICARTYEGLSPFKFRGLLRGEGLLSMTHEILR